MLACLVSYVTRKAAQRSGFMVICIRQMWSFATGDWPE
jgi:hypothetical protein